MAENTSEFVPQYCAELAEQLQLMARNAGEALLAHLLGLAVQEAKYIAQRNEDALRARTAASGGPETG